MVSAMAKTKKKTLQSKNKLTSFFCHCGRRCRINVHYHRRRALCLLEMTSENRGCCADVRREKETNQMSIAQSRRRREVRCGFGSRRRVSLRRRCCIFDSLRSPSPIEETEMRNAASTLERKKKQQFKFKSRRVDVPFRQCHLDAGLSPSRCLLRCSRRVELGMNDDANV